MIRSVFSCYLAQNTAIRLADEVLRYRDHDTSSAKTKFLDTSYATMVCVLLPKMASPLK